MKTLSIPKIGSWLTAARANLSGTVQEGNCYILRAARFGLPCGCCSDELFFNVGVTNQNYKIGQVVKHRKAECDGKFRYDGVEWVSAELFQ